MDDCFLAHVRCYLRIDRDRVWLRDVRWYGEFTDGAADGPALWKDVRVYAAPIATILDLRTHQQQRDGNGDNRGSPDTNSAMRGTSGHAKRSSGATLQNASDAEAAVAFIALEIAAEEVIELLPQATEHAVFSCELLGPGS